MYENRLIQAFSGSLVGTLTEILNCGNSYGFVQFVRILFLAVTFTAFVELGNNSGITQQQLSNTSLTGKC